MRTSVKWHIEYADAPGVVVGDYKYFNRAVGGTCEEDRQALAALSVEDKKAKSDAALPASVPGFVLRSCGTQPSDDVLIPYLGDGASFHPDPDSTPGAVITGAYETRYYTTNP